MSHLLVPLAVNRIGASLATRTIGGFITAFVVGLLGYPALITVLARFRAGQRIAEYGLMRAHRVKAGTPTMGGALFVGLVILVYALYDHSRSGFLSIFALSAGALLGMLDDLANVRGEGALGLLARQKLLLQAVLGVLVGIGLHQVGQTRELIPGIGLVDLGWGIVVLASLAIVAATNAVNLTDGVDGLAAACAVIALGTMWVIAVREQQRSPGLISAALVGGLLAFLIFNWWPARVFMGDTGSLALGSVMVVLASELRLLWLLPLLGIVFVAETLSVIINVTAITRFQRRLLRASPLHHHFELSGLREQKLVLCFAGAAAAGALATLALALPAVNRL
ncbi:MAG: phospho-N-acetylmuramoyl-pentapeptide-transferase [Candidatus Dormibacteria bacterium]